jgi:membrane protease YdiL (CAAX protease family)
MTTFVVFRAPLSPAVLFTATLFGIIHLGSGPIVITGAIVLGLVAGELRRRSGSLLSAVIVHALFNVPGLLWPSMMQSGGCTNQRSTEPE